MKLEVIYKNGACEEIYGIQRLRVSPETITVFLSDKKSMEYDLNIVRNFDVIHLDDTDGNY